MTTSTMTSVDPALLDESPLVGDQETNPMQPQQDPQPEPEEPPQRWVITRPVRTGLINIALDIAGLEQAADGTYVPIQGKPRKSPRTRLAAMRILASLDHLFLQARIIGQRA